MSHVNRTVAELKETGVYSAQRVDPKVITEVVNMQEWQYYGLDIMTIETYLGLLAQQALYVQQEVNIAEAREIELGKDFKVSALPMVLESKIRSVEERWIFASTLSDELKLKFDLWQNSIIDATLRRKLADPITEKLNVLKKIYDDRRQDGSNKHIHKYVDGK